MRSMSFLRGGMLALVLVCTPAQPANASESTGPPGVVAQPTMVDTHATIVNHQPVKLVVAQQLVVTSVTAISEVFNDACAPPGGGVLPGQMSAYENLTYFGALRGLEREPRCTGENWRTPDPPSTINIARTARSDTRRE